MKKITFFAIALLCCASWSFGQTAAQRRAAANALWTAAKYKHNRTNPNRTPNAIPAFVPIADTRVIAPNFNTLKNTLQALTKGNGGVIRFNNGAAKRVIKFNNFIHIAQDYATRNQVKTIVIQGRNIVFDGQNRSSLFVVRGNLRVIFQDAIFRNANFKGISKDNLKKIHRSGGAAIEVAQSGNFAGSLRVRNCQFINNQVSHYKGIGENQNGAAIRINNLSTVEVFGCLFKNNRAVTGGAIGGTSIRKVTIVNSIFDGNISNGYTSKSGYMRVVEGAGALRIDRTIQPIEIYGSTFVRNAGNVKASVMEVFIRPIPEGSQNYPKGNALIIDNCHFKGNKHYRYKGAINPQKVFFGGCMVFHSGSVNNNFKGGRMKMTNSLFENNEVGQANIRMINNFDISRSIFANTKYLDQSISQVRPQDRSAVYLQAVHQKSSFNQCTFYKNEPIAGFRASDIASWIQNLPAKVSLNNSIFYRNNKSAAIKQVVTPLSGSGNVQFIPGVNMTSFAKVSTGKSIITNPGLVAWSANKNLIFGQKISALRLCTNNLANKGGLRKCGSSGRTTTFVENTLEEGKTALKVGPNPTTDVLNIEGAKTGSDIVVREMPSGKVVLQTKARQASEQLNLKNLKAGMYGVFVNGKVIRIIKK